MRCHPAPPEGKLRRWGPWGTVIPRDFAGLSFKPAEQSRVRGSRDAWWLAHRQRFLTWEGPQPPCVSRRHPGLSPQVQRQGLSPPGTTSCGPPLSRVGAGEARQGNPEVPGITPVGGLVDRGSPLGCIFLSPFAGPVAAKEGLVPPGRSPGRGPCRNRRDSPCALQGPRTSDVVPGRSPRNLSPLTLYRVGGTLGFPT